MLQLDEEFSLVSVFEQIPREQLVVPKLCARKLRQFVNQDPEAYTFRFDFLSGHDGVSDIALTMLSCGLAIVGHERDGIILVSRCGYDIDLNTVVTFVDIFDTKKLQLRAFYKHNTVMHCIGCSANIDSTLLVYTCRTREPSDSANIDAPKVYKDYYESFVTETSGKAPVPRFSLGSKTEQTQVVQFANAVTESRGPHRLEIVTYISERQFGIFNIQTKQVSTKHTKILEEPKASEVRDLVVWYQWNSEKPILYLIEEGPIKAGTTAKGAPYYLSCFSFFAKKPHQVFRTPIDIQIDPKDKITVVRFLSGDESNIVLCQQHHHKKPLTATKATLFFIQHSQVVDFSVNIGDEILLSKIVVFFDAIDDMLLAYIPGYFLLVLDCTLQRPLSVVLSLTGTQLATPFPSQKLQGGHLSPANVGPFALFNDMKSKNRKQTTQTILDRTSGMVYRYRFNRKTLLSLYSMKLEKVAVQGIRLAIVHLKDSELAEEILIHVAKSHNNNCRVDFLKEYILGTCFQEFATKHDAFPVPLVSLTGSHSGSTSSPSSSSSPPPLSLHKQVLNLLPFSTIEPLDGPFVITAPGLLGGFDIRPYTFTAALKIAPIKPQCVFGIVTEQQSIDAARESQSRTQPLPSLSLTNSAPPSLSSPASSKSPITSPAALIRADSLKSLSHSSSSTPRYLAKFQSNTLRRQLSVTSLIAAANSPSSSNSSSLASSSSSVETPDVAPKPAENPMQKFFARMVTLLGIEPHELIASPQVDPVVNLDPTFLDPNKSYVIQKLADHFLDHLPRDSVKITKTRCQAVASEYRAIQESVINKLYLTLASTLPDDLDRSSRGDLSPRSVQRMNRERDHLLFTRFANLYGAIEEQWLPFPSQFREHFSQAGYSVLPQSVFVQYVQQGVFDLSPKFVRQVLDRLSETESDRKLKYLLLNNVSEEVAISLLERDKSFSDLNYRNQFLLEHRFNHISNPTTTPIDLEDHLEANFLPLAIFLRSVKDDFSPSSPSTHDSLASPSFPSRAQGVDYDTLAKNVTDLYSNAFDLPSKSSRELD